MQLTYNTLAVFVFLVPGFISSTLLDRLVPRERTSTFERIIEALIFTFVIYLVIHLATTRTAVYLREVRDEAAVTYSLHFDPWVLIPVTLLSLVLPLGCAYLVNTDKHMKLLRKLGISGSTARHNTWLDVFTDIKTPVVVHLMDGRRVHGWPMYYSSTPDEGLLYLYDPVWIDDQGRYTRSEMHGIFFVRREELKWIEFRHNPYDGKVPQGNEGDGNV